MKKITNAELRFPVNETDKSHGRPKRYQKEIPEKVKREDGNPAVTCGNRHQSKNFL